ncbi:MAG: hypothetical protein PHD06_13080, partial [Bacteroidales bacterium]|nr:hypothetical protein [Bacteroidales bacterium]
LSSATPAAASLVGGQALAPLVSVNLTAANDGAVTLKSIKFKKAGIASDSSFSNLYLYDGNTRLTDGSSMSNGYVNFSGASLVTIPAGQTKTLTVKADIATTANTGNIGLSLAAATDVVSTGATVNGSFPINGNLMSLFARPGDMSTVTLSTTAAATSTVKAGSINTIVWTANAAITSKPVDFKYLALQQVGSIQKDDLANFAIYVDGIKAGDGTFVDNKLVFDLSKAYRMNTGNHVIDVKADIVKGSSRNFSLQMQTTANAVFTDTNYNVNVAPSTAINGTSFTISSGSVTVSADSTFNATEIVKTASNATLARFTMKAWGEDVKINSLSADIKLEGKTGTTTEGMNDVAIYVDGNQVGSSQSSATSTAGDYTKSFVFGSNNLFTIEAGKQVTVEIHGSLSLDSNTSINKVVTTLTAGTNNAQGVTSFNQISTSAATPKTLNIVSGSVTVSKNGALQSMFVSKNSQKVKIGSYILSAASAEGVVISNIKVGLVPTDAVSPDSYDVMDNIANLYISENTAPIQPQTSNDFNVNLALAANATKVIDVYVDLNELDEGDKLATNMQVTYRTEKTMNSGTTPVIPTPGQDMTVATGSLGAPTLVSTPNSFFVLGGSEATAANYKFVAENADAYINELSFATVTDGINQIIVNGVSAVVVNGAAKVSGLNVKIPAGLQGANVEVKAVYNNVTSAGQGGVETYANQSFYLDSYKYTVNGTQTTNDTVSEKSKDMKLVASYPLVANAQNYTDTTLKIGPKTEVMRFSVAATGNNPVNLDKVSFNLSSNHVALAAGADALKVVDATDLGTYLGTTSLATSSNMVVTFADDVTIDKGSVKTFVVYADTTGTLATGTAYFGLSLVNAGWAWNDGTTATSTGGTHIAEFTGTTFTISN